LYKYNSLFLLGKQKDVFETPLPTDYEHPNESRGLRGNTKAKKGRRGYVSESLNVRVLENREMVKDKKYKSINKGAMRE